ncbi:MAG: DUF2914 domain-containing protein [Thermoanaerobaculaceae bacterium]|jgi:hypothetical protein
MRTVTSCLALLWILAAFPAAAADTPAATAVVCTSITPSGSCEGADTTFSAEVGKLWGFSQVTNVSDKIIHIWIFKDKEKGRLDLPVRAARWRTWSNITVTKDMVGPWRLEARDSSGKLLASFNFTIH